MRNQSFLCIFSLFVLCLGISGYTAKIAQAQTCYPSSWVKASSCSWCGCNNEIESCQNTCIGVSNKETGSPNDKNTTIGHITNEFKKHQVWMTDFFVGNTDKNKSAGLLAAMQLMTAQLTNNAMMQVQAIGKFFDAKHQLETQRLFQILTLKAHKDYHPSEELCEVGTLSKSLSSSNRNTNTTSQLIAKQATDRQVLAKDKTAYNGVASDSNNRLVNFIKNFCNKNDNNGNLNLLCLKGNPKPTQVNRDIDYASTVGSATTLDIDFQNNAIRTDDEKAIIALSQNLFAHRVLPFISSNKLVLRDGTPSVKGAKNAYLNARAVMAKRSVAVNSFSSIAALKTKGNANAAPFIYSLLKEMGGDDLTALEIQNEIGARPSYDAQMDVLTKKLYQRPEFYSELYDKPANVMRKNVALQAATLMQKRDLYQSYLRSEMTLAVMLETLLVKEQRIYERNLTGGGQ